MGFTKEILRAGNGIKPTRGQSVTVHCTGYGKNRDLSQKFWSTKDVGQKPFTFNVGLGKGESYEMRNASIDDDEGCACTKRNSNHRSRSRILTLTLLAVILLVIKGWDESVIDMSIGTLVGIRVFARRCS